MTKHLDWISDLGANCIWITPVFTCQSYHGYDSLDYHSIDPRFGGEDAFRRLIDEVHKRDVRILMDIVPNHVSNNHEWFQSALAGGPEREWFGIADNGVGMQLFTSSDHGAKWGLLSVGAVVAAGPIVITFLVAQRAIISGLTGGSVKGQRSRRASAVSQAG